MCVRQTTWLTSRRGHYLPRPTARHRRSGSPAGVGGDVGATTHNRLLGPVVLTSTSCSIPRGTIGSGPPRARLSLGGAWQMSARPSTRDRPDKRSGRVGNAVTSDSTADLVSTWDQKHPRSPFGGGHPLRGLDSTGLNQERDTRTPQKRHHRIIESSRLDWFRLGIQNTYRQTAVACPRTEHFEHFVSVLGTEVASVSSPPCGSEGVREKKIIKKWHVSVVRWCGEADQGCLISRQICRVCREAFSATQQSDSQRGDSTSRLLGSVLHLISCTRAVPA